MKLWAVNGIWSRTIGMSKEMGGIMWTVTAATEAEATGYVFKEFREQQPGTTIESLYATDISEVARTFVAQNG